MTDVLHGYTLHDLNGLARSAAITASPSAAGYLDRYEEAWSAIVERLVITDQQPAERDLWYAGLNAVRQAGVADRRHHGATSSDGYSGAPGSSGRFAQYWAGQSVIHDFSGSVIDRYAAFQIWPELADVHQQTLLALAAAGDLDSAASALGVSVKIARQRVSRARAAFRTLWHEHETPPPFWRRTHRPADKAGLKPCGTPSAWSRHKRRGEPVDQACAEANRAYMSRYNRSGGA